MECKFCSGSPSRGEIVGTTKRGEPVCEVHSQLIYSVGGTLDRLNKRHVGTYRALEPQLAKLRVESPVLWSVDKGFSSRIARGNRAC